VQSFSLEEISMKYFREHKQHDFFFLLDKGVENSFMVMGQKIEGKTLDSAEFNNRESLW